MGKCIIKQPEVSRYDNDIKEFGQLCQQLEDLLNADKKQLLQRIGGYARGGIPATSPLIKLTKTQKIEMYTKQFL